MPRTGSPMVSSKKEKRGIAGEYRKKRKKRSGQNGRGNVKSWKSTSVGSGNGVIVITAGDASSSCAGKCVEFLHYMLPFICFGCVNSFKDNKLIDRISSRRASDPNKNMVYL